MRTLLVILLLLAAADLFTSVLLLAVVWVEYQRVRREALRRGEPAPSAAGQIGCLMLFCFSGVVLLTVTAWLLLEWQN